jgi:hypothetical protein
MIEDRYSILLHRTALTGVLLGIVASIYFVAGLFGAIANPAANILAAVAVIAAAIFFFREFAQIALQTNWVGRILWMFVFAVLVTEILLCLVPPTARDELTHHLAIPRLYVRSGKIIEVPMALYSYYPMLLDMLYTPWVAWGYDFVPKLIHCLYGFLTGLLLYAYSSRRMNSVYGLLGFLFFISLPAVLRIGHWAYVDLGTAFYAAASLFCLLRWREENHSAWLIHAALASGFCAATKPNGLLALFLLTCVFIVVLARRPRESPLRRLSCCVSYGLIAALPLLPWLIKNWLQTGNPFFPLLGNFFPGSPTASEEGSAAAFAGLAIFAKRALLYGESWWEIAALPLRVFIAGRDDSPQYFDGILSPILILFLPWAFKGKWREEKVALFTFALVYFAYAVFLADLRIRYILPIVPALVVLFGYGVFNIYLRMRQPVYLFIVLIGFLGWQLSYLVTYVKEVSPFEYLSGRLSRSEYLNRNLPGYAVFEYANRELPADAKIYLLFLGRRTYYCERDCLHDSGELPGFLLSVIRSARDPMEIGSRLRAKNITHLMMQETLLGNFLRNNLNGSEAVLWDRFAAQSLELQFRKDGYSLYRIHA